jgi:hypothetical protein
MVGVSTLGQGDRDWSQVRAIVYIASIVDPAEIGHTRGAGSCKSNVSMVLVNPGVLGVCRRVLLTLVSDMRFLS